MNIQRAKKIAASPVMKNVTHDGIPVYIQHVDDQNETVRISHLDEPEVERNVPVDSLKEFSELE
jgi:small acid-soluble spore protein H (minor)